jgi:hypothetical protein
MSSALCATILPLHAIQRRILSRNSKRKSARSENVGGEPGGGKGMKSNYTLPEASEKAASAETRGRQDQPTAEGLQNFSKPACKKTEQPAIISCIL